MERSRRQLLLVTGVTLLCALLVLRLGRTPPIPNTKLFDFPFRIGEWLGTDIAMDDYVYDGIETPYLFMRDYRNLRDGRVVNLALVWFDDTNVAFHTPESCFSGASTRIVASLPIRVPVGGRTMELQEVVLERGGAEILALYFFDADGVETLSQSRLRIEVLRRRLLLRRASASFVRVMAAVPGGDRAGARRLLTSFLADALPLLPGYTHTDRVRGDAPRSVREAAAP